jgi:hypothetical protein
MLPGEKAFPARSDAERDYLSLSLMDGSQRCEEAVRKLAPGATSFGDIYRAQRDLFNRLCDTDPTFQRRDEVRCRLDLQAVPRYPVSR